MTSRYAMRSVAVGRYCREVGHAVASLLSRKRHALRIGADVSLCDRRRLEGLQRIAAQIAKQHLNGDIVECGVYRGGSAVILGERLLTGELPRTFFLYDVFNGMPAPGPEDPPEAWEDVGKFVSSPEVVRRTFARVGLPLEKLKIFPGYYEETLHGLSPDPVAFLHLDCDWYDSVRLCLDVFYDAVVPGGAVVFDDYGHWSGCRKAVDEFFEERGISLELTPIDYTSHYFFKP